LESAGWRGVVFASVDPTRLIQELLGTNDSLVGFRLYTGGIGGEKHDLVAESGDIQPRTADRPGAARRGTLAIPFFYRRLHVEAWTTSVFEAQSLRRWPWVTATAGLALTLLTAGLLFVQVQAREAQGRVLTALRAANSELLQAYQERDHLSRDLHDGSIQNLYALGLHLQRVQALLETQPGRARTELTDSLSLLDQSIAELRQFILNAGVNHPHGLTVTGALEGLIERLRKTTETDFELRVDDRAAELPAQTGVQLLNLVREATSNALRHSGAKLIRIGFERMAGAPGQPDRWRLHITDNGAGFDVRAVNGQGRGLKNLASRAAELGGRCDLDSAPGRGTRVEIEFPA
jgi:signal transduction histidine kinase